MLTETLLPKDIEAGASTSQESHSGEGDSIGHDYLSMDHVKAPRANKKKYAVIAVIGVIGLAAIIAGVMMSRSSSSAALTSSGSQTSTNTAATNGADGVLDATIPQSGATEAGLGSDTVADPSKPNSSSSKSGGSSSSGSSLATVEIPSQEGSWDDMENEYTGDYEYGSDAQQSMDNVGNDDRDYMGSYDGDYDNDESCEGMVMEEKHEQKHEVTVHTQSHTHSSLSCRVNGNDLIMGGIDGACVKRVGTQEIGVVYAGEATFSGMADDIDSIEVAVYQLYDPDTGKCNLQMEKVACA